VAVVSAGPHASLHLAPGRQPRQHPTTQFFTGWMPFLPPNQQRQSTEGTIQYNKYEISKAPLHNQLGLLIKWLVSVKHCVKSTILSVHFKIKVFVVQ